MNNRYIPRILVLVWTLVVAIFVLPYFMPVQLPNVAMSAFGSETARARVTQIIEDGNIDLGATTQRYQIAACGVVGGGISGNSMEMDYGKRQVIIGRNLSSTWRYDFGNGWQTSRWGVERLLC